MVVPTSLIILVGCSVAYKYHMHHFTDNTSLLYGHKSIKKRSSHKCSNKRFYTDSRANRIYLNGSKTEIMVFKPIEKNLQKILIFKWGDKTINTKTHSKYLEVILHEIPSF